MMLYASVNACTTAWMTWWTERQTGRQKMDGWMVWQVRWREEGTFRWGNWRVHIQREEETDIIIFLNIISRKLKSYSHILQERKVRDDRYYCCPLTVVLLCFCLNQSFVMLILICLNQSFKFFRPQCLRPLVESWEKTQKNWTIEPFSKGKT